MLQGKMTYVGVAVWLVGMLLGDLSNAQEVQSVADNIAALVAPISEIVGTFLVVYGRYRIKRAEY
jgi:hypothetical protein